MTMSSESPTSAGCGLFSFCRLFKRLFAKAPSPSVLSPLLRFVVQASPAFPPLQSAAGGLLNVIDVIEVRRRSYLRPRTVTSPTACLVCVRQKATQNDGDVEELKTCFSKLRTMLEGPLHNAESCPAGLRERIERFSR